MILVIARDFGLAVKESRLIRAAGSAANAFVEFVLDIAGRKAAATEDTFSTGLAVTFGLLFIAILALIMLSFDILYGLPECYAAFLWLSAGLALLIAGGAICYHITRRP